MMFTSAITQQIGVLNMKKSISESYGILFKLVKMTIIYLFCNYIIWFELNPCITFGKEHVSFFWGMSPTKPTIYPVCVLLPILLFQPHTIILYRLKPLKNKKEKTVYWGCSVLFSSLTIAVWFIIINYYI